MNIPLTFGWVCCFLFVFRTWQLFRLRKHSRAQELLCIQLREKISYKESIEEELLLLRSECKGLKKREGELEAYLLEEKKGGEEKVTFLQKAREELVDTFRSLSSQVLANSNQSFLQLAEETMKKFQGKANHELEKRQQAIDELVRPMNQSLHRLDCEMRKWDKERKGEQEALRGTIEAMIHAERELKNEAATLAKALRDPIGRGRWGELHLRRVVELAGMVNHCDFYEQKGVGSGKQMRPDLVVHLPGKKQVVVDAKISSSAYFTAMQARNEEEREKELRAHARQLKQHILTLGKKKYWEHFSNTPEFVVLFIPSDNFFHAALEFDPSLIEIGVEEGVMIATPTTLIGLLRAIAYGWQQETMSEYVREVKELGYELYCRLEGERKHFDQMGRGLKVAVDSYNRAIGSFESRVLVSARKFQSLGVVKEENALGQLSKIESEIRGGKREDRFAPLNS